MQNAILLRQVSPYVNLLVTLVVLCLNECIIVKIFPPSDKGTLVVERYWRYKISGRIAA